MRRLASGIAGHPWITLAITVGITVFLLSRIVDLRTGTAHLSIDTSVNRLLPEDDPEHEYYQWVRRVFGSDETILVALSAPDVFRPEPLQAVVELTDRIEGIEGVHHVVSLATALDIRSVGDALEIEPFLESVPTDPAALAELRERVLTNPIYAGTLVSRDGGATALMVYLLDIDDAELARVDAEIEAAAREVHAGGEIMISGAPHIKVATGELIVSNLSVALPMVVVAMLAVALISFRSLRSVAVAFVGIAASLVWTLGIISWMGRSLNLVSAIVPPLVLTVGFSYFIHVIADHAKMLAEGQDSDGERVGRRASVEHALADVALPVLLTALTTVAGFLSLTLSRLGAVQEVGVFSVIGVLCATAVALTMVPAVLAILGQRRPQLREPGTGLFDRWATVLANFDIRRRIWIFAVVGLVTLVSVGALPRIHVSNEYINFLPPEHEVRRHFEGINEHLSGSNLFYIVVETDYRDAFKDPVNLHAIEELENWLVAQEGIGSTTSLVDYLKLINRGFHGDDPAYLRIPESQRLASQLLFFGANDELDSFVDSRFQILSILVRSQVIDSAPLSKLVKRIEDRLAELPSHMKATVTGNTILVMRTVDDVARGQATSLSAAFLAIFVILSVLFMSVRMGLLALVPNVVPVAAYFGTIALTGVPLNSTNGLVACIVLGIAVDDTIHYFVRFGEASRRLADNRLGAIEALRSVARPVTFTTLALVLGFLVLTTVELRNWVQFGALAAFTLGIAWAMDVTFSPALASRLRIVSLWDVLTLDLGKDPHRAIGLFHGLSARQARIVALMAGVEEFPKGHTLFRAGEKGREMYVVIEGEVTAYIERDGQRIELTRHRRGDAVGEVALFHGERTANAEVTENARLLRLTRENLDRLRRRYPRIAATVLRNLNELLGQRIANEMRKLA